MDFLRVRKFRKAHKPDPEKSSQNKPAPQPEEPKEDLSTDPRKSTSETDNASDFDDDDDDFITNEVKRRLKELRSKSFLVLIPEEGEEEALGEESEDEGETSSNEWRDLETEGLLWGGFDAVYDKYCERMLFFDRLSSQQLKEAGSLPSTPSPRSTSKKLASPLRCLSLKKFEVPEEETERLQQETDPYQDLETAYVAQLALTWETLHCQYTQLISSQPENPYHYNHSAQQLQQFQVLLQRFIENEPFELGQRPEVYTRARNVLSKLLQVPKIEGSNGQDLGEEESGLTVLVHDLIKIMEASILTFYVFLKMDKKKPNGVLNLFGNQNHMATPLQQVQSCLEKKKSKLKDLRKKAKGLKKWPHTREGILLLFAQIDVKIISRVLRMAHVSKDQLFWCEEKMKKIDLLDGKLQRDPSPILFPC